MSGNFSLEKIVDSIAEAGAWGLLGVEAFSAGFDFISDNFWQVLGYTTAAGAPAATLNTVLPV